jgi:hypothetical protein
MASKTFERAMDSRLKHIKDYLDKELAAELDWFFSNKTYPERSK